MRKDFTPFEEGSNVFRMPHLRDYDIGGPIPRDSIESAIAEADKDRDMLQCRFDGAEIPVFPGMTPEQLNEVTHLYQEAGYLNFLLNRCADPAGYVLDKLQSQEGGDIRIIKDARFFAKMLTTRVGREAATILLQEELLAAFELANRYDPRGRDAMDKLGPLARQRVLVLRGQSSGVKAVA